jgi:hypothetical protein
MEAAIKQDPSSFQQIITSSTDKAAQNKALQSLQDIGNSGGLQLQDKAALQDSMLQQQTSDRSNRLAINDEMSKRGLGGSGFDVAAQLQGQQGTSDQAAKNSLSVAAQAQARALDAIQKSGQLATQYRDQDFSQDSAKAQAQDAINKFNTQNMQDVQQRNVGSANYAAQQNLAEKQKIADQNTSTSNYQQEYNNKLIQQQLDNQFRQTQGATGQANAIADTTKQGGQQLANSFSNVGTAGSNAATSQATADYWKNYYKNQDSDEDE